MNINCRETGLRSDLANKIRFSPKITFYGRLHVIAYRATLDVPRELVQFTAKLLAAERRRRGTPTRQPGADLLEGSSLTAPPPSRRSPSILPSRQQVVNEVISEK